MYRTSLAKKVFISLFLLVLFSKSSAAAEKPEIFVQMGHSGTVNSVVFSPDGRFALSSGSYDKTLKFWEVATGKEIRTFSGHTDKVSSVAFSPDGRYALSGGWDKALKLWDIASGKEIRTFTGHRSWIASVAFSPDGKYALSGAGGGVDDDHTLKLWEVETGKEIRTFSGHTDKVSSVAFSPNGRYVLSGSSDKTLKLWDVATGKEVKTFEEGTKYVYSVSFSPDGRYALSGGGGDTLKLWDISTGKEIRQFAMERVIGGVDSVVFSPDGKYALSGSWELILWEVATGKEIRTFKGHTASVSSVAFSPDGRYALSGSEDKTLILWEVATGKEIRTFSGHSIKVSSVAFSPNGVYAGGEDGILRLWDISTGKKTKVFTGHSSWISSIALSPDGKYVLSGSQDVTFKLWDIETGKEIKQFTGHKSMVNSAAFSPDGKYVLSGHLDATLKLWDAETSKEIRTFTGHTNLIGGVTSVAFSPDGKYALSGDSKGIKLWDISTGQEIRTFLTRGFSASFSPDGRYVLSGSVDGTITIWDILTGKEIRKFPEFSYGWLKSLAFSPDGNYALSGDENYHPLRLWDISTEKKIRTFLGHTRYVTSIAFSPDSRYAFSGSADGTTRIWDINTGKELAQFISFTDGEWIVITPEGYYNSSANGDKHLNVRIGNNVYGIENYREAFYRPDLVKLALSGGSLKDFKTLADVKQPPVVTLVDTPKSTDKNVAAITLKITDIGGGIGDIRLYLNGSAVVLDSARGVKIIPKDDKAVYKAVYKVYNLKLSNGLNTIRAIAFNGENTMQSNDVLYEITATFKSLTKPSLNAIIVGINEYKNPKLQLKYAVSDAELFEDTLKKVTAGLFEKVNIKKLVTKEKTTNESIIKELKAYKSLNPDDVFVFFVASHGTVDNGEYFLITSNVGSTRTEKLKTDALPQGMLKELIANIPVTKKLIIIDTCSAGALGEAIQVAMLTRGMSEDTAMKILSRAVGSTILSASTSLQEAVEGYQGHGLFTYVLVEGLKGKADKGKTGYVKTTELADYVDSEVPVLAERVFKKAQYPTISISGQAFPIGKTGK
ncbi:MAG: hypothetical protein A2X54_05255 [Nitrospirae bacterium GWF2_44_13]|nr:MAG: hypothetical protein A2X54_05255 [Nitrospirae bacterium GWF2_44_13]OGW65352.1 MAG: hypothetical protein A2222_00790 [Nitrospirae bacterium RIFOXYA2_FULL_44_9]OGW73183.1 MAG: hypothetical protein A2484_01855 [Nitrospirae bacterium RIFOXYC2_FULL_44_7]